MQSWFIPESVRVLLVGPNRVRVTDFGPGVFGANRSEVDARFPYIRDVIRARNRHAAYKPIEPGRGSDAAVRALQEKLVALGYLDARHADGLVGRTHSATLDAVAAFQKRNRLKVDRDLGGPHSLTHRKLAQPIASLARGQ